MRATACIRFRILCSCRARKQRKKENMVSFFQKHSTFRRLLFVLQAVGDAFLIFPQFCSVVRKFTVGAVVGPAEEEKAVWFQEDQDEQFASETRSHIYLQGQGSVSLVEGFISNIYTNK